MLQTVKVKIQNWRLFGGSSWRTWPLVMSSLGFRDKCTFYKPENKSWICVITEEVSIQSILYLYQLILNIIHNVWYAANAHHVTSVYFTDWSVYYWKWLTPDLSRPIQGMTLKLSPKKLLDKRWLLLMTSVGSRDKAAFYRPEVKSRVLRYHGRSWYVVGYV